MQKKKTAPRPVAHRPTPAEAEVSPYYSRAVAKAIDTIEFLAREAEPVPLHKLAARLKLTKASMLRILGTLEGKGILMKDADSRYSILSEGRSLVPPSIVRRLEQAAAAPMRDLLHEFRETISLAALFTNHVEVIAVLESPEIIRMGNTPGRILPPHASSLGKAIAAFLDPPAQFNLVNSYGLQPFTPATIVDELALRAEYDAIRRRGYSLDREETVPEGNCFGAPILDEDRHPVGSLSLSIPKARVELRGGEEKVIRAVRRAAEQISRAISAQRLVS